MAQFERLKEYCRKKGKEHPELHATIQDCYEMAIEEVSYGGSEEHETELAISFIDSEIKKGVTLNG